MADLYSKSCESEPDGDGKRKVTPMASEKDLSGLDWDDDEAVVRAAHPHVMSVLKNWSRVIYAFPYQLNSHVGEGEHSRLMAWKGARQHETVQAFEALHNPAKQPHAQPSERSTPGERQGWNPDEHGEARSTSWGDPNPEMRRARISCLCGASCTASGEGSLQRVRDWLDKHKAGPDPQPSPVDAPRACTCHPDDAPVPCQHRYATTECQAAAKPVDDLGELERLSGKADWRIGRIVDYLASDIQEQPREELMRFVRNEMMDEVEEVCQPLIQRAREAERKLAVLFDSAVYSDSYGVEGSDFSVCRWCGGGSSPGKKDFSHNEGCLFDDAALEKSVENHWSANDADLAAAEQSLKAERERHKTAERSIAAASAVWERLYFEITGQFQAYREAEREKTARLEDELSRRRFASSYEGLQDGQER